MVGFNFIDWRSQQKKSQQKLRARVIISLIILLIIFFAIHALLRQKINYLNSSALSIAPIVTHEQAENISIAAHQATGISAFLILLNNLRLGICLQELKFLKPAHWRIKGKASSANDLLIFLSHPKFLSHSIKQFQYEKYQYTFVVDIAHEI